MTHDAMQKTLGDVLEKLSTEADFPCERRSEKVNAGRSCLQIKGNLRNEKTGAPLLWYATDAAPFVLKHFCATCAAYWHVAVARNLINDHGGFHSNADDKAARISAANGDQP